MGDESLVDCLTTLVKLAGRKRLFYVLRGLGVREWREGYGGVLGGLKGDV